MPRAGQQPIPYNLEAEQAVLGCVIIDNSIIVRLSDEIAQSDFYDRRHQILYQAMINLYRNDMQIDYTTLISELQSKNQLDEAGGVVYLASLIDSVYTTANIEDYISIVTDSASKRNIIAAASSISDAGYDANYSATEYIDYAEKIISDLAKKRKSDNLVPVKDVVENVEQMIITNRNSESELVGLSTGYHELDSLTLGLQKQNLIILAARPAMGKSAFAMNLALNIARKQVNENGNRPTVAIFSFEMSQEQITQRMLASMAQLHLGNIQKGNLNHKEMSYLKVAINELSSLNLYYSDSSLNTVADIRAKCRRLKQKMGLDFVVIDYLQLINTSASSSRSNRQEQVAEMSRALKQLARELDIPILALSQLSRDIDSRENKHPVMSDLRESGAIEQDADLIMFLYREYQYNKDAKFKELAELTIGKNRSGSTGDKPLKFLFKGEYQLFTSYEGE